MIQSKLECVNTSQTSPCLVTYVVSPQLQYAFQYSTDEVSLIVTFVDASDPNGTAQFPHKCQVKPAAPTSAPTAAPTKSPTSAPTYGGMYVYFDPPMCDNSSIPFNSVRSAERCGCDNWSLDCGLFIPILLTPEKKRPELNTVPVKRNISHYIYDLHITYNFSFVTRENATMEGFNESLARFNRQLYGANTTKYLNIEIPPDSWFTPQHENNTQLGEQGPSKADIKNWQGEVVLQHGDVRNTDLGLKIFQELPPNGLVNYSTDLLYEVFLLTLTSCRAVFNSSRTGAQSDDIIDCTLSYPNQLFVIIQDTDERITQTTLTTPNKSYQSWLWYVLAGIAAFLAVAGFMAYRWWVNNKMKQAEVKQADEDIDAVIQEQEGGFGRDLDQVAVNPLAQPFTHLQGPTTKDFNTDDNDKEDGMTEKAEVRTEKNQIQTRIWTDPGKQENLICFCVFFF
jgi:hypothetical protein